MDILSEETLSSAATQLLSSALAAVEPAAAMRRHITRTGNLLTVAGRVYNLDEYAHVYVIGGGKAAAAMGLAAADILGDYLTAGVLVTRYGHATVHPPRINILEASHPIPDENSLRGARAVMEMASRATEQDLVLCLLSGGASALLALPAPGLSLADLQALTGALLRAGATINELNTVRKHCSAIAGGRLAQLVAPATLITLALSDVIGDLPEVIGSGPTVPDPTTVSDAQAVLMRRLGLESSRCPFLMETPKPGDPVFARAQYVIIGSNRMAALAAVEQAALLGFNALLLSTFVEGEAREVARVAAALAKGVRTYGDPVPPPACLVWGGETTVTVRGPGKGGRNTELALAAALALEGCSGVLLMTLATDGSDGPTDAAGALVTGETASRARALGIDPLAALEANDSYSFFDRVGGLIRTGPTGTNVNDLLFILVG